MGPYRSDGREERAIAPRDPGIVGEIIAQFADRFAFLRELVQNAIDAGSPAVEVRVWYDAEAEVTRVAVRDQGEGMSRDTVENQLLVLFRSTKEKDDSKIGKFGIGFVSVLATGPRLVVVKTAQGGKRLTLHLHPDLTYQLFDGGAATQSGTTVELELPMGETEAYFSVRHYRMALERWCRHAVVPITFNVGGESHESGGGYRIDCPLGLDDALVEVHGSRDGGQLTAVVGLMPATASGSFGYFNHGLMLEESNGSSLPRTGGLAFKVQDSRLGHTLSRDAVRRDEHYDRALAFVRELDRALQARVATELHAAAEARPLTDYRELVAAIEGAIRNGHRLSLSAAEWSFPLVELMGGRWAITAEQLVRDPARRRVWSAPGPSSMTAFLARAGVPVLELEQRDADSVAAAELLLALSARIALYSGCEVAHLEQELIFVEPLAPSELELVMLGELAGALAAAHRAPSQISLARLSGAAGRTLRRVAATSPLAICGGPKDAVHILDEEDDAAAEDDTATEADVPRAAASYTLELASSRRSPFTLLRTAPLVLDAEHPLVLAARRGEPRLAASHLARAVLSHYRLLTADRSEQLLAHTLGRLGLIEVR